MINQPMVYWWGGYPKRWSLATKMVHPILINHGLINPGLPLIPTDLHILQRSWFTTSASPSHDPSCRFYRRKPCRSCRTCSWRFSVTTSRYENPALKMEWCWGKLIKKMGHVRMLWLMDGIIVGWILLHAPFNLVFIMGSWNKICSS